MRRFDIDDARYTNLSPMEKRRLFLWRSSLDEILCTIKDPETGLALSAKQIRELWGFDEKEWERLSNGTVLSKFARNLLTAYNCGLIWIPLTKDFSFVDPEVQADPYRTPAKKNDAELNLLLVGYTLLGTKTELSLLNIEDYAKSPFWDIYFVSSDRLTWRFSYKRDDLICRIELSFDSQSQKLISARLLPRTNFIPSTLIYNPNL
jgi:hypothetical protein